jgi:TetR/AcrR family transcriptional regulator, repressor for neighboring sulfatase
VTEPPRGREAIRRAVLDAARRLFAQRNPASVSMRAVAEAAGVNYGLLHRHFRSKTELVREVVAVAADETATAIDGVHDLDAALAAAAEIYLGEHPAHARSFAWFALEDVPPEAIGPSFATTNRLVDLVRTHNPEVDDAEAFRRTVVIISLFMGWSLFRRYWHAFGADATGDPTILDADLALLQWAGTTITMAPPTGRANAEPRRANAVTDTR